MRRVSKSLAAASLIAVLTASNIYAIPSSRNGAQPGFGAKIIRIIRQVIGLDDLSWPKP
jgi:hypothetical protein